MTRRLFLLRSIRQTTSWNMKRNWPLHFMLFPAIVLTLIFSYAPMFGLVMAFQEFKPWLGVFESSWVGISHFQMLFMFEPSRRAIVNTLVIAILKIFFNILVPLIFALLLNEVRKNTYKRTVQTIVYLPYFISWVMFGAIMKDILSIEGGLVNQIIGLFGIQPIFFLGNSNWFLATLIASDVWKNYGFSTIIFLASLTSIDITLYEAAVIDGADRWQQTIYITLPSILPIVIVVGTLSLGNILNAGFDQIFNMYNPLVYDVSDIIDTYVYRVGLISGKYSFATAVGLFKSVVSFILIFISYRLAAKFAQYRIF